MNIRQTMFYQDKQFFILMISPKLCNTKSNKLACEFIHLQSQQDYSTREKKILSEKYMHQHPE